MITNDHNVLDTDTQTEYVKDQELEELYNLLEMNQKIQKKLQIRIKEKLYGKKI